MDSPTSILVELLVRSGALSFGDFTAKSGRATPYFVDFGRIRSGGDVARLGELYADAVVDAFGHEVDVVFGPAYKGIPLAVSTAVALARHHGRDVGFCFDRKEAKDHGEGGDLVGHRPRDGDRVVIVEDVTTAGTSVRDTVPRLRAAADIDLRGLVVGVDRAERGHRDDATALDELAGELGIATVALATIDDVVDHLTTHRVDGRRVLGEEDRARIAAYRAEYGVR